MSAEPQPQEQQRSLYRRHRPRTFAEVVGQEPVVRTLRNAVERGKVHHAYLFVGSRGTGKTSMAKILAACLNCELGPTIEPCGRCDSCVSIARASSLDVIEMDAASNNSVEDIRELRESVAYAPVSGRRKVYILDEAHMLSTAAWNAFLKTLEEPPPNTVFVLATTEAAKVPATVVDRCHRFDFQRPSVEQIASVLRRTAEAEAIEIPPAAVAALARAATGSFRDALGTLEQIVTYGGSPVELADVLAVLGVADSSLLEATVDAVAAGDSPRALMALEEASQQGGDASSFASALEVRARELLIVQTLGSVPAEISLTPESDAALTAQAGRVEHAIVVRLLELIGEAIEAAKAGADPRTRLELALVKAARPEVDPTTRALLARIERLEATVHRPIADASVPRPAPQPPAPPQDGAPDGAAPQPERIAATAVSPAAQRSGEQTPRSTAEPAGSSQSQDVRPAAIGASAGDLQSVVGIWPAVVDLVRGENALLGALIAEARPAALAGDELTLEFAPTAQFLKKKAEDPANKLAVGEALRAVSGTRWRLRYELGEASAGEVPGGVEPSEEEWVARFMVEFDAEEIAQEIDTAEHQPERDRGVQAVSSNEKGT